MKGRSGDQSGTAFFANNSIFLGFDEIAAMKLTGFLQNLHKKFMTSTAKSPADYIAGVPAERAPFFNRLRETILENLPDGFEEAMSYGMIGYVVPKNIYPAGYHCDPKLPLPFVALASQKNFIAIYHMGIYADPELLEWFRAEWPKQTKTKLDMGKSCIRLAKFDQIPFGLFGELLGKMSVEKWVSVYESAFRGK